MVNRACAKPVWMRRRRALHEKERACRPLRIALHHHRTVLQVRQQYARDGRIVRQQLALRDVERFPKHFLQIGQAYLAAAEIELCFGSIRRNFDDEFSASTGSGPPTGSTGARWM